MSKTRFRTLFAAAAGRFLLARFLSALLMAVLILNSAPAYSLRPMTDHSGLEERFGSQGQSEDPIPSWLLEGLRIPLKMQPEQMRVYLRARDPDSLKEYAIRFLQRNQERIPDAWAFVNIHFKPEEGKPLIVAESFREALQRGLGRGLARLLFDALQYPSIARFYPAHVQPDRRDFLRTSASALLGLTLRTSPLTEDIARPQASVGLFQEPALILRGESAPLGFGQHFGLWMVLGNCNRCLHLFLLTHPQILFKFQKASVSYILAERGRRS